MNVAIVRGRLSSPPRHRTLVSGDHLVALEITVARDDGPDESVPVAWPGAPDTACSWTAGQELVVVGRVRRRFFRAGGATASRTEVVAEAVVPATRRAATTRLLSAAVDRIGAGR